MSPQGGIQTQGHLGGAGAGVFLLDPQNWMPTLFRALKDYVLNEIDPDVYDIVFDFPAAFDKPEMMPSEKVVIHFTIDDIDSPSFGMGHNVVHETIVEPSGGNRGTVVGHEAGCHFINFDVGVWATDNTGGVTARWEGYQALWKLFHGADAYKRMRTRTGGVEIIRFNGGRFITERVADIPVFRTIDSELVVRVYSERLLIPDTYVEVVKQQPGLHIGDEIIVP